MSGANNKSDLVHSDLFVVMFLGFATASIPELRSCPPARLLELWEMFKHDMGKQ